MAEQPLTPEHAREYQRLVDSGAKPGADTFKKAGANIAKAGATDAALGGPENPVADVAAVGSLATSPKKKRGPSLASRAESAGARVSSPSAAAQTITRIVWAVALGLIVLEIASEATGQFWNFNLKGPGLKKEEYQPFYTGQQLSQPGSPSPANALPSGGNSLIQP